MSIFFTGEMPTEETTVLSGVEGEVKCYIDFIFQGACGNFDSHFTNRFTNIFCSSFCCTSFFVFLWIFPKIKPAGGVSHLWCLLCSNVSTQTCTAPYYSHAHASPLAYPPFHHSWYFSPRMHLSSTSFLYV